MISQQIAAEVAVVDTIHLTTPFREPKNLGRGNEHVHFILSAMKLRRPALKSPAHYWATQYAKWQSGEQKENVDPYVFWYMSTNRDR
jgi:hypothetical protein